MENEHIRDGVRKELSILRGHKRQHKNLKGGGWGGGDGGEL